MSDDGLSPRPEATSTEPEKFPGGADSVADAEKYGSRPDEPTVPDLHPDSNPAVDDIVPAEVKEPEDAPGEDESETLDEGESSPEEPA